MIARMEADRTPLLLAAGLGTLIAISLTLRPAPQVGLAFLVIAVVLLALFSRRTALYLVLPAMALSPEMRVAGVSVRIEDFFMIPLAVGWLAHVCVFRDRQRTPLDRLLIAYLLAGVVATVWGTQLGTVRWDTADKFVSAPFHLLKRIEFVLLFFIFTDTLSTPKEVVRFTYFVMGSLIGLSGFALAQYLSNGLIALSPTGAPVHEPGLASLLNVVLALSLFPAAKPPARLLLGAIILFSVAVLPLSLGRNFIAATALVVLYVGLFQQRWILACLPVPWLLGMYLYPAHVIQRVLSLEHVFAPDIGGYQSQGAALLSRAVAPSLFALITLGYSPVLGFGLASRSLGAVDSEYVVQLLYTGLVGLAIFFLLGARLFRMTREAQVAAKDPLHASLANAFRLVLAAYAIFSIFSPSISAARGGGFFFVIVASIAVLHRSLTQPEETQSAKAVTWPE